MTVISLPADVFGVNRFMTSLITWLSR